MKIEKYNLWNKTPGMCEEIPAITAFIPDNKKSDGAIVILAGGAYMIRASHEGEGYAKWLAERGITAFVCDYRVSPHQFPLPLADSRRSIKFVRFHADKYGIDKNKVFIMGSSAGGHLAALTSTYFNKTDYDNIDQIDNESFIPDGQILCYPVIKLLGKNVAHLESGKTLLGENQAFLGEELSPDLIATEKSPKAFIWHNFDDEAVNVLNSIDYVKKLKSVNVDCELHIFPKGGHGIGLALNNTHVAQWSELLYNWLIYNGF